MIVKVPYVVTSILIKMRAHIFNIAWFFTLIFWGLITMFFAFWGAEIGPMFIAHSSIMRKVSAKLEIRNLFELTKSSIMYLGAMIGIYMAYNHWNEPWRWRLYYMTLSNSIVFIISMILSYCIIQRRLSTRPEIMIAAINDDAHALGGILNRIEPGRLI